jgi:hypothetical protein
LWHRKTLEHVFFNAREQIREPCEGQLRLGGCRSTGKDAEATLFGQLKRLAPDGGLSDPGLAFQDKAARTLVERLEKAKGSLQLAIAPDHL